MPGEAYNIRWRDQPAKYAQNPIAKQATESLLRDSPSPPRLRAPIRPRLAAAAASHVHLVFRPLADGLRNW